MPGGLIPLTLRSKDSGENLKVFIAAHVDTLHLEND